MQAAEARFSRNVAPCDGSGEDIQEAVEMGFALDIGHFGLTIG